MSNRFRVDVHNLKNFNPEQVHKAHESFLWLEKMINSDEFWHEVESRYYNWSHRWTIIYGLPRKQLSFNDFKELVLSGKDKFNKESDGDLDLYLTLYYSWKNTVGYTYPTTFWTWTNRKFFIRFDYADFAGHVLHEYLHNIGMDHPRNDRNSVVYQCGYLMRDMIKEEIKTRTTKITYTPWYKRLWRWIF